MPAYFITFWTANYVFSGLRITSISSIGCVVQAVMVLTVLLIRLLNSTTTAIKIPSYISSKKQ